MNFGSWVVLLIVVAILALAIRATFFKKRGKGGCCPGGDEDSENGFACIGCNGCSGCGDCTSCAACHGDASAGEKLALTKR